MEKIASRRLKSAISPPNNDPERSLTSVLIWIDPETNWYGNSSGKRGRSQIFSDVAIDFCLAIAWVLRAPLRRAIEEVRSVLKTASLDWRIPNYSTLSRRNKEEASFPRRIRRRQPTLHLLLDDDGVSVVLNSDGTGKNISIPRKNPWRGVLLTVKK